LKLGSVETSSGLEAEAARITEAQGAKERDSSIMDGLTGSATQAFVTQAKRVKITHFVATLLPMIPAIRGFLTGEPDYVLAIAAVIVLLTNLPIIMDRPGAWLKGLLQKRLSDQLETDLCKIRREDLLHATEVKWREDGLSWSWKD
jgi:hypothetical protein